MKKHLFYFFFIFLFSCINNQFDTEKWKSEESEQFYMINDIVKNNRLKGKSKKNIIELLDTKNIKKYNYSDNSWMFIVSIPNAKATQSPIEVMYVNFKNDKVESVTIDQ